jgi:hypothetical protein
MAPEELRFVLATRETVESARTLGLLAPSARSR